MAAGESLVFLAQLVVLLLEVLIVATKALYLLLVLGALLLLHDDLVAKLLALEAFNTCNALNGLVEDGLRCTRCQEVLNLGNLGGEVFLGHGYDLAICVACRTEGSLSCVVREDGKTDTVLVLESQIRKPTSKSILAMSRFST